jgi:hypothetical protein
LVVDVAVGLLEELADLFSGQAEGFRIVLGIVKSAGWLVGAPDRSIVLRGPLSASGILVLLAVSLIV